MTGYVDNILTAYYMLTEEQRETGRRWYPEAHKLAIEVGDGDSRKGAGIIAALSPQKSWELNVKLAVAAGQGIFQGHTRDNLDKARAIWEGEDPSVVLPNGKKTWNFFYNIWLPDAEEFVTIDRHAYRVATWGWDVGSPVINVTTYREISAAHITAGRELLEITCDLQAELWEPARQGAFS